MEKVLLQFGGFFCVQRKRFRFVLTVSAIAMVLNAQSIHFYTHLEIQLVWKTEAIETGTVWQTIKYISHVYIKHC